MSSSIVIKIGTSLLNASLNLKENTNSKIYAYCLMTNHIHLLIEPSTEDGIGRMIQSLGRKYVQHINQTYKRTGTLWEGRYKSSLVSKDDYLLACYRYIELNPIRANLVKDPAQYFWSSYAFRAEGKPDRLLSEDSVYKGLGDTPQERQKAYKEWIKESIPDGEWLMIRQMTQRGGVIGTQDFKQSISKILSRDVTLHSRGRPRKMMRK